MCICEVSAYTGSNIHLGLLSTSKGFVIFDDPMHDHSVQPSLFICNCRVTVATFAMLAFIPVVE